MNKAIDLMKKVLLFLLFLFSVNGALQAQSKEKKQVAAAVEKLRLAMIEADKEVLNQFVMDELNYGHSSGKVENKVEFIRALTSGDSDFKTISLSEQTVQLVGKTAVLRHLLTAETNDKGVSGSVKLSILQVWRKQHGKWRLLARQAIKA